MTKYVQSQLSQSSKLEKMPVAPREVEPDWWGSAAPGLTNESWRGPSAHFHFDLREPDPNLLLQLRQFHKPN
jgi:hypothetical protein